MKRSGSNRVPRRIASDNDDAENSADSSRSGTPQAQPESVVKRPIFGKNKKRSSLRISFGPDDASGNDADESSDSAVVTPKKTNLSRLVMEKNAEKRARSPLISESSRRDLDDDRPSYSKDHLAELRDSTPSTPKDLDLVPVDDYDKASQELDISSKFGSSARLSPDAPSAIPTAAEIMEKKARRARAAREAREKNAGISGDEEEDEDLNMDDDEFRPNRNEISLRPKDKWGETRLIHEDEDMAEGFEDFTEDGRLALGRRAEREAAKKRRAEMADLIADAEGSDDDGSDDSEAERNAAYEEAQTRAGTHGKKPVEVKSSARQPPKIIPVPTMDEILALQDAEIAAKEFRKEQILKQLEEIKDEKERINDRQKYIQKQLEVAGERYEKLRIESGMPAIPANGTGDQLVVERGLNSIGTTPLGATPILERGLESIGTTPMRTSPHESPMSRREEAQEQDEEDEDYDDARPAAFSI
ncbi:hypothetical protein EJ04DRAFT_501058 [Polyplosphaeria fusca]|uniref:Uncharacterized protein n=1 Tax=Polyplosphaeria fusca TaxID=682080 RepID=A0A9P4UZG3_9PLEO|nr:hypothetical protein EJ04DRAFT_501058 [Polyplosphaeria fusca]